MPIINSFNYYRVDPIMKIDHDKNFIKKDSNSKQFIKQDNNRDNQGKNEKSFSEIFNEYLTGKK